MRGALCPFAIPIADHLRALWTCRVAGIATAIALKTQLGFENFTVRFFVRVGRMEVIADIERVATDIRESGEAWRDLEGA